MGDGPWVEATATSERLEEKSPKVDALRALSLHVIADSVDTTTSIQQYTLAAGLRRGQLQLSGRDRIRTSAGSTSHAPGGQIELDTRYGLIGISAERDDFRKRSHADAVARLTPLPFLAVSGAISRTTSTLTGALEEPDVTSARIEAGIRLFGPWISAGFVTRDTATLLPLRVFDTAYVSRPAGRSRGAYVALRGTIVGDLGADIVATRWDSTDFYRPKNQARSEVSFNTRWLSRFPSGSFGFLAVVLHEYRGGIRFPVVGGVRTTTASNTFSALFEIRILRGVISYQVRNIAGELHQFVPDFYMPRAISLYGIRWEFWN